MSGLSPESRAELEALRASLRRKASVRGKLNRATSVNDYVTVSESEAGFAPPTDAERERERQRIDMRETMRELHTKPRAWTSSDDDRFDGYRLIRDDEGEVIGKEKIV